MQARADGVGVESANNLPATVSVGWFIKRTIIGIFILAITVGGMAWLTYASIDPALELRESATPDDAAPAVKVTRTQL